MYLTVTVSHKLPQSHHFGGGGVTVSLVGVTELKVPIELTVELNKFKS